MDFGKAVGVTFAIVSLHATIAIASEVENLVVTSAIEAGSSFICIFDDSFTSGNVANEVAKIAPAQTNARHVFTKALRGFSRDMSSQQADELVKTNRAIKYCEPNSLVWLNVVTASGQRTVPQPQIAPYGVTRVGGPVDGTGRHVWIVDTGIDLSHPDLNIGIGANFVKDRKGKLANSPADGNGHGTHVAGIIGAINNGIDVVGVAAGATVHPVCVLDSMGLGSVDSVLAGIDYVYANGKPGDVVNLSLAANGHFQSLHDAIINSANNGILFAIAAGNNSGSAASYEPAHIEHPNVYTVSAIDSNDVFASFSNFGNPPIDWAAVGVNVLSSRNGGGTIIYSGTSMASPHVAGILLFARPRPSGTAYNDPDGIMDSIAHF